MTRKVEVPALKVGDLREYLGALAFAVQALREREAELVNRFEWTTASQAREARDELEELREIIDRGGEGE